MEWLSHAGIHFRHFLLRIVDAVARLVSHRFLCQGFSASLWSCFAVKSDVDLLQRPGGIRHGR